MEETPNESSYPQQEEQKTGRVLANWRSCLLLFVMFAGLLATPLAVFYRWYSERPDTALTTLLGQGTRVNRIAYITPDGQLATMAPDGSDVRQLTDESYRFEFPAWSPDGQQLAVTGGGKVLLITLDSGPDTKDGRFEPYDNLDEPPFYLYWSPDSAHLTFLTSHPEGIALHSAQSAGAEAASELIAIGQPLYWDWSPVADELLIHSGGSGSNARLEMIDLHGATTSSDFGDAGIFQAPGISSGGRFRAFAALDDQGRSRLIVQDIDGETKQYEAHSGQLALAWSPVADLLAYKSPRLNGNLGGGPLRLIDPRTNDGVLLSNENVLAFFWSPDGRTIAYFSVPRADDGAVRVAALDAKEQIKARKLRQQGQFRMELWAVDVSTGDQRRLAQFIPTSRFLRQFLPFFDQYALSHRVWSPNSDALVLPVLEDGRSQIAVVPLSRGQVTLIADGEIAFWSQQ